MLPQLVAFTQKEKNEISHNSLFIASEGFEDRSLAFASRLKNKKYFRKSIIFNYDPEKKSRLNDLLPLVKTISIEEPIIKTFFRFEPQKSETEFENLIKELKGIDEIIIDISVMSKLMILIIINALSRFAGKIRIIYSEPISYVPTQEEFKIQKNKIDLPRKLPSFGVHDVVRTSALTSIIMQRSPSLVIAFASFNEQLVRALLSVMNPSHFFLINGVPPTLSWREGAMFELHKGLIDDYSNDNILNSEEKLDRRSSTLFYQETFELLAEIYKKYCYVYRIVLAPTGSKMQALGCALLKICCPDIHIEYPTPESFYFQGYSSKEIKKIHQVVFDNFSINMKDLCEYCKLNG